jgi:phage terminase Nu1 subunit (DNA packaging protein)
MYPYKEDAVSEKRFVMNATDMGIILGVSRQTVYRYIKHGCPWEEAEDRQGKAFHVPAVVEWYVNYKLELKQDRIDDLEDQIDEVDAMSARDELNAAKAKTQKIKAEAEEIKLNVMKQKYLEMEKVVRDFRELANLFRVSIRRLKGQQKDMSVAEALDELNDIYISSVTEYMNEIHNHVPEDRDREDTLFDDQEVDQCLGTKQNGERCHYSPWKDGFCRIHHPDYKRGSK